MIDNHKLAELHCGKRMVKPDWRMMRRRGNAPIVLDLVPMYELPKWIVRRPVKRRKQMIDWLRIAFPGQPVLRITIMQMSNMKFMAQLQEKIEKEYARLEALEHERMVNELDTQV